MIVNVKCWEHIEQYIIKNKLNFAKMNLTVEKKLIPILAFK